MFNDGAFLLRPKMELMHKLKRFDHLARSLIRFSSTAAAVSPSAKVDAENTSDAKPFSAVPGPRGVPVFGNLLDYKLGIKSFLRGDFEKNGQQVLQFFIFTGPYSVDKYHEALLEIYKKYGPLVRQRFGGRQMIHVFDPDDARIIFANEGKMPNIVPLQETAQMYREMRDLSLGLGNM